MIEVRLMAKSINVASNASLYDLLLSQNIKLENYAIMLNNHFIPRSNHKTTLLQNKDVIELISPMQGG